MDDFERRVQAEIDRLRGPGLAKSRRARQMRNATIRALGEAAADNRPWTGEEGVLGPKRPSTVVGEKQFYEGANWHRHPLVREVIEAVTALYVERNAAEKERARQNSRVWVEQKEMEAAAAQFDKAADLLKLPHVAKKTKQGKEGDERTVILDPANAAVFNAAVKLNLGASDLARRALGLPTDVSRSEVAVTMSAAELRRASDEELEQIVNGR